MKKLLLINTSINTGSTGRIAEEIGLLANQYNFESYAAYGIKNNNSQLKLVKVGNSFDNYIHALRSRLEDNHGFSSTCATRKLIKEIGQIKPDIINLHNVHGYYLNVEVLFQYLAKKDIPIVWTLHDCWPFTGHCSYFDAVECDKWKHGCHNCPNLKGYPASLLRDNSKQNFERKRQLFTQVENLTFVAPCNWMADIARNSFMKDYPVKVIHNGVDLSVFRGEKEEGINQILERFSLTGKRIYLGVASIWDKRKGLEDFRWLSEQLEENEHIVLIGLNKEQIASLPKNITGISRTENVKELATWYSAANVFVNPTYVDNFPTTNIEALACGTPVVTYETGGSPEAIDIHTGRSVKKSDRNELLNTIREMAATSDEISSLCRQRAETYFDKNARFEDYVSLFKSLV